jgi:hypothetical protein
MWKGVRCNSPVWQIAVCLGKVYIEFDGLYVYHCLIASQGLHQYSTIIQTSNARVLDSEAQTYFDGLYSGFHYVGQPQSE